MITHKFREVMSFADDVTVLRRGRFAGQGQVAELTPAAMAEMMMGQAPPGAAARGAHHARWASRGCGWTPSARWTIWARPALRQISLDVGAGEIVGRGGHRRQRPGGAGRGAGRPARRASEGRIHVHGLEYEPRRDEITQHKVRCLPEEPLRNACVPGMSVAENLALHDFDRPPFTWLRYGLSRRALAARARQLIAEYGMRTRSPDTPIGELSGGNVQRVVLARALYEKAEVLVVANPCMGLDFAAVAEIHTRLREARDQGAAILLVSADLDELLALADRILVLSDGKLVHETTPESADLGRIGACMAGHAEPTGASGFGLSLPSLHWCEIRRLRVASINGATNQGPYRVPRKEENS